MVRLGIVGGSSLVSFDPTDEFDAIGLRIASTKQHVATNAYGAVDLKILELKGANASHTLIFMQRHGHSNGGSITPPHKINHLANMRALADLKVDAIVATSSVGTILESFPPGRVGVADQFIDFSGKVVTYHDEDARFTSVTEPFHGPLNAALTKTLRREQKLKAAAPTAFTYWLSNGPYYETPAEVTAAERMGAHVCGMTAVREAKLCCELQLPYSVLLIASNWAAGRTPGDSSAALCHEEVSEMSKRVTGTIVACLSDLLKAGNWEKAGLPDAAAAPPTPEAKLASKRHAQAKAAAPKDGKKRRQL